MLSYPEILSLQTPAKTIHWTEFDSILYALAIGMGSTPGDQSALRYVYERNLHTVPTVCSTISRRAHPDWPSIGIDYDRTVHLTQRTDFHRPMSTPRSIAAQPRIREVYDLGAARGALLMIETVLVDLETGENIATESAGLLARANGGLGADERHMPARHLIPSRPPDETFEYQVPLNQALLYRLLGDRNPLHVDPQAARQRDFHAPILHGLCTYGMMCRALLERAVDHDASRIRSLEMRFTAPVYPGDGITIELWKEQSIVSFVARSLARNVKLVDNGRSELV